MARRSHSKPEIEAALKYAEANGWRVDLAGSHAWGKIYCPYNDPDCRSGIFCVASIWSTPKNSGNHAKQIRVGLSPENSIKCSDSYILYSSSLWTFI
jgi:hypothetical protein